VHRNKFFSGDQQLSKVPPTDPGIIFYCHLRTWQFFSIGRSGPEDFLKLPRTDRGIFFNCHLRTWQLFFIGSTAGGGLRRRWGRFPGFFRQNCRKAIRELFFIIASGPGNFLKLSLIDPAIFLNWQVRTRQFSKTATNRSGNYFLLPDPDLFIPPPGLNPTAPFLGMF